MNHPHFWTILRPLEPWGAHIWIHGQLQELLHLSRDIAAGHVQPGGWDDAVEISSTEMRLEDVVSNLYRRTTIVFFIL